MSQTLERKQERKQRSTQFEMHARRQHVLESLQSGPKSIQELFGDTEWTYAQAIITIRKMKEDREIYQTGKDGREVIYALREEEAFPYPEFERITQHVAKGDEVKIVALHLLESDGCRIDLQFSNGDKIEARLVS
jgi:hypothetical protein